MAAPTKPYRWLSEANTNREQATKKDTVLTGGAITNASSETRYVKLYDLNAKPTLSSSLPKLVLAVPAGTTLPLGQVVGEGGIQFVNGISFAITKKGADTNEEAVAAGDISLTLSTR